MPERSRLVVSNTTPIISLALIGRLDLLHMLYDRVVIPSAVEAEVLVGGAEFKASPWLHVASLQDPRTADLIADLDRGEAEVIALAQDLGADLVIIDERLARWHAKRLGLTLTGTLGILLKAKQLGYVDTVAPLIDQLRQGGIRLSDALVNEVLLLANE